MLLALRYPKTSPSTAHSAVSDLALLGRGVLILFGPVYLAAIIFGSVSVWAIAPLHVMIFLLYGPESGELPAVYLTLQLLVLAVALYHFGFRRDTGRSGGRDNGQASEITVGWRYRLSVGVLGTAAYLILNELLFALIFDVCLVLECRVKP